MKFRNHQLQAWLNYLQRPIRKFMPLFLTVMAVVVISGLCFWGMYRQENLTFTEAMYVSFSLIFMEHLYDYPLNPLLQFFYFALPPLGLVLVLDGFVRFTYSALRRDETSPEWVRAMSDTFEDHVVLFGLGKVGFRVLEQLVLLGEQVVVIEKDDHCPHFAYAKNHDVPMRIGSGREEGLLDDVNLAKAKSLICATNDDLANIELAIDARKMNEKIRLVVRLYDQELAEKLKDAIGLDNAFSTAMISAPLFATASMDPCILNSFYVDERLLVIAQIEVNEGSELQSLSVGDISRKHQMVVVTYSRDGNTVFHPPLDVELTAGDVLRIECDPETLKEIHRLNRDPISI